MTAVQPGSDAVGLDPPANSAITQQPGGFGSSFGPPGVTVRYLTNSTEDSEFAGRLIIVAFEPKVKHAAGERNIPAMIKSTGSYYGAQDPPFYQKVLVAECDGRRAGVAHLRFHDDADEKETGPPDGIGCCAVCGLVCMYMAIQERKIPQGKCNLDAIAVEDGFRGRGIGKALLDQAEQESRSRNCKSIYLSVMATNRAKNLYERQGYVVMSEETCCGCLRCTVGEKSYFKMEKMLS